MQRLESVAESRYLAAEAHISSFRDLEVESRSQVTPEYCLEPECSPTGADFGSPRKGSVAYADLHRGSSANVDKRIWTRQDHQMHSSVVRRLGTGSGWDLSATVR